MNLIISKNIDGMNLSKWEKIFAQNYYDGKRHKLTCQNKDKKIKNDINKELDRLYNLTKEDFKINSNSREVLREYNSELNALRNNGEDTKYLEENKDKVLNELANFFSEKLYEEYKYILNCIKGLDYSNAFKVMMLRETILKTYKLDKENDKINTIIKNRNMHSCIQSHLILNETVLKTIYDNIDNYSNFATLYFFGVELFKNEIASSGQIDIDDVKTYKMGKWIKFDGKISNPNEYIRNSKKLASLVQETSWCTKTLATAQLSNGDFYLFVDKNNNPHIAVKMLGNKIDEVRGIANGDAQELEEEYRKIAISFLEKNKDIVNGKKWLEKEEWNKRLVKYNKKIENGTITDKDIPSLINDYIKNDYRCHNEINSNIEKLKNNLFKITDLLAKYYDCKEEEILLGDFNNLNDDLNYVVIFGDVDLENTKYTDLNKLKYVIGDINFTNSEIIDLNNLEFIGGSVSFELSKIYNLNKLKYIGKNAYFNNSNIIDLGDLEYIGKDADFKDSQIISLKNIRYIGGNTSFRKSKIFNLGDLQRVDGNVDFGNSLITSTNKLKYVGGSVLFSWSNIIDLNNLLYIGNNADFSNSKITSLLNLQYIGGTAQFSYSNIIDLGALEYIGKDALFLFSKLNNFGSLKQVGGNISFSYGELKNIYDREFENGKKILIK